MKSKQTFGPAQEWDFRTAKNWTGVVRKARLGDLPAACRIFEVSLPNVGTKERLYALARERGVYVVDVTGRRACGFYVATLKDASTTLWVEYLGVHPGRQRSGLGRLLMEHCEQLGQALSLARVGLRARDGAARAFYERLGYVAEGPLEEGQPRLYKPLPESRAPVCEPSQLLGRYRHTPPSEALRIVIRYAALSVGAVYRRP